MRVALERQEGVVARQRLVHEQLVLAERARRVLLELLALVQHPLRLAVELVCQRPEVERLCVVQRGDLRLALSAVLGGPGGPLALAPRHRLQVVCSQKDISA